MIDRIEPTSRHSSEDDPGSPFESRHGCGRIGEEPKMLRRYFPLGDPFPGLRSAPWTRRLRVSMLGPHWSPERRDRDDPAASTIATMKASTAFGRPLLAACGFSAALLCATPATAQDSVERVVSLVSQGRYPEARTALEPLLKRQPNAARPRLIDGILRAREGQTAEAISIFEGLRTDRPDMFEVHNNLAVLYARQGRLEAARAALLAALERRSDATVHANLGDILTRLAERAYARARDLAGGSVPPPDTRPRPASPGSGKSADSSPPETRDSAALPPSSPPSHARSGPLTLVLPDAGDTKPVPSGKPAAPTASSRRCLHAGRFGDRAAATGAAGWLQKHGAKLLEIRHERRRVVKNHRVYLPAGANARQTAATVKELRGRGLRDVATIAKGPMAGRISLGLFKSADNANRRVAQLKKLGYPARSAANATMIDEYAVRAVTGGDRPAFEAAWKARFPGNPVRYIPCP